MCITTTVRVAPVGAAQVRGGKVRCGRVGVTAPECSYCDWAAALCRC